MRMAVGATAAALVVLIFSSASAAVRPGSFDPRFGSGGKVASSFTSGQDYSSGLAVLPNGKLVVAGEANGDFLVARYLPNGKLDRSFGTGGKVTTDFGNGADATRGLAVQRDGKIVVAGFALGTTDDTRFALARYNPNGTLDRTFDHTGKVTTVFAGGAFAEGLAIRRDGKIVAAGGARGPDESLDLAVARYNRNGTLDTSFSGDGMATRDVLMGDVAYDMLVRPDGSTIAAGLTGSNSENQNMLLAGFDSRGNPLAGFGTGGNVTADFQGKSDAVYGITRAPNGNLIAVGYAGVGNSFDSAFLVVKPKGAPDPAFDGDGKKTINVSSRQDTLDTVAVVPGLFPQAPKRIVTVGSELTSANDYDCYAVSLDLDGRPNTVLGPGGVLVLRQSIHDDYCGSMGIADRGVGVRDLVLFGGDDPSSSRSRVVGAEIFADPMSSSCPYRTCRFFDGTSGADRMTGTRGRDVMLGHAGDDVLNAGAGNNLMNGGPGIDTCRGNGRRISCEKR